MTNCAKCNALLKEGDTLCPECGLKTTQATSVELSCSSCGQKTSPAFVFCQGCGAPISSAALFDESFYTESIPAYEPDAFVISDSSDTSDAAPVSKKKKLLPVMIAAGVLAVVVAVTAIINPFDSSVTTPILYIKNKDISITLPNKIAPFQLTEDLYKGVAQADYNSSVVSLLKYSKNGRYMAYADKIDRNTYSMTLYHRDLKSNDSSLEIDSGVSIGQYELSADGKKLLYLKGEESDLYLHNLKDKEKIGSGVGYFYCDENMNKVVYEQDGALFIKDIKGKKDREKIASVTYFEGCSKDLSEIYYWEGDSLYVKSGEKDSVKITSDISYVVSRYDDGSLYYVKSSRMDVTLSDYITDDMKDSDAQITEPKIEDFTYPDYDAYYEAVNLYREKQKRDVFRELLFEEISDFFDNSLYYYDGSKETLISDRLTYQYIESYEKPVIAYSKFDMANIQKIDLSELTDTGEVFDLLYNSQALSLDMYVAYKDKEIAIQHEDSSLYSLNNSGTKFYFVNNFNSTKELMEVDLSKGEAAAPVEIDNGIVQYDFKTESDQLYYFKYVKRDVGDLYENEKLRASNVYLPSVSHVSDSNDLAYLSDYDTKNNIGTLTILKSSRAVEISDDVSFFHAISSKCIVYLKDYNTSRSKGDLFLSKGSSKSVKIDENVRQIITSLPQDKQNLLWFPKS